MRKYFYVGFSIWSSILVIIGFWPRYFGLLASGNLETQVIIHLHAVIFSGWIILFFLQAYWILKRNANTHKRLGKFGIYYGILVMITGLVTSLIRGNFHNEMGNDPAAFFSQVVGIRDIIVFGFLFYLAIHYRNKPQIHRIWILGASSYLLVPAVSRANGFLFEGNNITLYFIWLLPVVIALVLDYYRKNPFLWHYFFVILAMVLSAESLGFLRAILQ